MTLPLSYSRLRGSALRLLADSGGQARKPCPTPATPFGASFACPPTPAGRPTPPCRLRSIPARTGPPNDGVEPAAPCPGAVACQPEPRRSCSAGLPAGASPLVFRWLASRSLAARVPRAGLPAGAWPRSGERRLVAREGFEPSKALGRQIYSLLRLTASLPRRYSRESATEHAPPLSTRTMTCQDLPLCEFLSLTRGAGEGI